MLVEGSQLRVQCTQRCVQVAVGHEFEFENCINRVSMAMGSKDYLRTFAHPCIEAEYYKLSALLQRL